jgi:hypothetical protein
VRSSTPHNPTALYGLLRGYLYFLYLDNIRASQEIHLWASTACYGDSFIFLYVDNVRTSQETHLWISTDSILGIALLFFQAYSQPPSQATRHRGDELAMSLATVVFADVTTLGPVVCQICGGTCWVRLHRLNVSQPLDLDLLHFILPISRINGAGNRMISERGGIPD